MSLNLNDISDNEKLCMIGEREVNNHIPEMDRSKFFLIFVLWGEQCQRRLAQPPWSLYYLAPSSYRDTVSDVPGGVRTP